MLHWIWHYLPQIALAYFGFIVITCVFMTMSKQAGAGMRQIYRHEGVIFHTRVS